MTFVYLGLYGFACFIGGAVSFALWAYAQSEAEAEDERTAIEATIEAGVSEVRAARERGDTRGVHHAQRRVRSARTEALKAEIARR